MSEHPTPRVKFVTDTLVAGFVPVDAAALLIIDPCYERPSEAEIDAALANPDGFGRCGGGFATRTNSGDGSARIQVTRSVGPDGKPGRPRRIIIDLP